MRISTLTLVSRSKTSEWIKHSLISLTKVPQVILSWYRTSTFYKMLPRIDWDKAYEEFRAAGEKA